MQTECSADLFGFAPVDGRRVVAAFDGGTMTSEAGVMLLGATDGQIRLIERFAGCFTDYRAAELVEHTVPRLVGQRVFGIALGYEDLIDHDQLRHDPVMAVLGGKLEARRADCAPLAGKSTLNRLELSRPEPTRYHKISYDAAAIEGLFVDAVSRRPFGGAAADHPRSRRHRRPAARASGGAFFPRLLRQLLLSAALCVLRPASAGEQIAPGQHRRQRRQHRGGGADRRPDPSALAQGAHSAACRFGLCPRGADGVVREQRRRFPVRLGQEQPADRGDRGGTRRGGKSRADRPKNRRAASRTSPGRRARAGAASGGSWPRRNGPEAKPIRALSSLRWHARLTRPATSTRSSTAPAARWKTASRSASSTSMPTAPLFRPGAGSRPKPCAPTNCGCGSPRWPMCCCARCAASASSTPSLPAPHAAPSASSS